MTVLSVAQSVAAKVGINPVPTSIFGSDRTSVEMRETVKEAARQIADSYDWSRLKKIATITGDGVLTAFPLATSIPDLDRFGRDPQLFAAYQSPYGAYRYIDDFNTITAMQSEDWAGAYWGGAWSVYGDSIHVFSGYDQTPLAALSTVSVGYISNQLWRDTNGGLSSEVENDLDSFVLDERLLKLCVIWNWKQAHGQSYASEMEEYENALTRQTMSDRKPQIFRSGFYGWGADYRSVRF